MHGCDHRIGCLTASAWKVGGELSVTAARADFAEEKDGLELSAWRVGGGLSVMASLTCSVGRDAYLRISTDTLWLTPDMIAEQFEIYSNVSWTIDVPEIEEPETVVLEYLQNGTLLINDTLLKNEDVTTISIVNNGTLVSNAYYFTNY